MSSRAILRNARLGIALAAALTLAACGGGGDAGLPVNTSFNVSAAHRNLLTQSVGWAVTGTGSDGLVYEVSLALAPGAAAAFPLTGVVSPRQVQTFTLKRSGVVVDTSVSSVFYNATSYALLGSSEDDGTCAAATMGPALPSAARLRDTAAYYNEVQYSGCTAGLPAAGSSAVTWSVELEGSIVFFCANRTVNDASGVRVGAGSECVQVDEAGALGPKAVVSIEVTGQFTLVARN